MVTKVNVKGRFFDMPAKEAAKVLGINYSTFMGRIRSDKPEWAEWQVSELSVNIVINDRNFNDIDQAIFHLLDIKKRTYQENNKNKKEEGS